MVRRRRRVNRKPVRRRGRGFFDFLGKIADGVKSAVRKPSTWLGAAGMIPSPLAPLFKAGGTIAGLAGHGRRRRRPARRRRAPARRRRGGAIAGHRLVFPLGQRLKYYHDKLKASKFLSRGLSGLSSGFPGMPGDVLRGLSGVASHYGYGKRKPRRRVGRRRVRRVGRRVGRGAPQGFLNVLLNPQRMGY
jgi:hypothetical protein